MAATAKSLAAHDKRFHGGHYEGGACKYREKRGIPTTPAKGDSDSDNAPSAAEQYIEAVEKDMKGKKEEQLELKLKDKKVGLFQGTDYEEADKESISKLLALLPDGMQDGDFGTTEQLLALDKVWMQEIIKSVKSIRYNPKRKLSFATVDNNVELSLGFRKENASSQVGTLLHEFGHCILHDRGLRTKRDCNEKWRKVLSVIQTDVNHLLSKCADRLSEWENKEGFWQRNKKSFIEFLRLFCGVSEEGNFIEEEVVEVARRMFDMIAAGTHGKYGFGHNKKYFRRNTMCIHEFFANLCVLHFYCPSVIDKWFKNSNLAIVELINAKGE